MSDTPTKALTADEQMLRDAVLYVVDSRHWRLFEGELARINTAVIVEIDEDFANKERLDFTASVLETYRRFKTQD